MALTNNDILRNLRYIFNYSDEGMTVLFTAQFPNITSTQVTTFLRKDDHEEFRELSDEHLAGFLNQFIKAKRGNSDRPIPDPETVLTNNLILKKLRIALALKTEDMVEIYRYAGMNVSPHEINAFFRKPGQRQYRKCLDQFLRNFLYGLKIKYKGAV